MLYDFHPEHYHPQVNECRLISAYAFASSEQNAVAAMRAMNACNLSYFLADTQRISFDMAVRTMYETGISMNRRFLETSEGGLAKMYDRRR